MDTFYDSKYTGSEIDEILDRAKSNGPIDKAISERIPSSSAGIPNGVATLDADGKLATGQIPVISKIVTISLSTDWTGNASPYTQTVTISGVTANSKVDLQPDATAIAQMADDGTVALYIANNNGTLTANAVGEKPTVALTIQATITEVSA